MKLFQIEEPDGAPVDSDGHGAAVGIDVGAPEGAAVAIAVGGNAEILPGDTGERRLMTPGLAPRGRLDERELGALLRDLRGRAERQLQRPVTHAVIAAAPFDELVLAKAAEAAGLEVLRLMARLGSGDEAVLAAAVLAEDLAPAP
ncbi:MAG TPA: hypothetical protein VL993_09225 [Stellaceae bacterium]|nr:hypothetical protein [Stellaceae bacterium]